MGSKKQADAAQNAANIAQGQAGVNRSDQMPYIQSGYGALSRLNTLMGIGGASNAPPAVNQPLMTGVGGQYLTNQPPQIPTDQQIPQEPPRKLAMSGSNPQLRQILSLRAQNGDAQASQLLKMVM
jgi:hypothetical protein